MDEHSNRHNSPTFSFLTINTHVVNNTRHTSIMPKCNRPHAITDKIGQRWEAVVHWKLNINSTWHAIGKPLGHSGKFVKKWVSTFQSTQNVLDDPTTAPGGRTQEHGRVLNHEATTRAADLMRATASKRGKGILRGLSSGEAARVLATEGLTSKRVHSSTVRRTLQKDMRFVFSKGPHPKMIIRPGNITKRLAYARKYRDMSFKSTMFVDSKVFVMRHAKPPGKRPLTWAEEGTHPEHEYARESAKVHMYAGVSRYGVTSMVKSTGSTGVKSPYLNPRKKKLPYTGVCGKEVDNDILPSLIGDGKRDFAPHLEQWTMLLDGAKVHAKARSILAEQDIECDQNHPAQSPDLNPIENAWSWVEHRLHQRDYANLAEFEAAIREIWASIPLSICRSWVGSMNRRMRAVISNNGSITKY